jgi:hypothetical protein
MRSLIVALSLLSSTFHHGWEDFRTERPLYLSGTVTQVRWGNPHPEVRVRVAAPARLPSGLAERSIPAELEQLGGRDVLRRTQAFDGREEEVVLILAPVERLTAWGMTDRVREGERVEAVGYVHREHAEEFRPELLVRQDGQAVRQRSVPLPQSPPPVSPGGPAEQPDGQGATTAAAGSGQGPVVLPWLIGGALLIGGGTVALTLRARRTGGKAS